MSILLRIVGAVLWTVGLLGVLHADALSSWISRQVPTGREEDLRELFAARGIAPIEWCGWLPLGCGLVLFLVGALLARRCREMRPVAAARAAHPRAPARRAGRRHRWRRRPAGNTGRLWSHWLRTWRPSRS